MTVEELKEQLDALERRVVSLESFNEHLRRSSTYKLWRRLMNRTDPAKAQAHEQKNRR